MDLAEIGIKAESKDLVAANKELNKFEKGADRASRSADKFGNDNKKAATATDKLRSGVGRTSTSFATLSKSIGGATKLLAGFVGLTVGAAAFGNMIADARNFNAQIAEVSTLLPAATGEIEKIEKASRDFVQVYGGTATDQAKAFYQAISAGAGSAEEATMLLDAANKTAIGGVTDVSTAVDGLTTATNAYRASGLTAVEASDALFVGMRAGKTTIGELSSALGQVVPIASSMGVSFDEVVAATSALTTQGLSTAQAVTGLRGILAAVVKPTSEASKMAAQLGLNFNAAALKSMGLQKFLAEMIEKTGGSEEKMGMLVGQIEGLNAVLSFAGGGGEAFNDIMDSMAEKAGATDEAFKKVNAELSQRLSLSLAKLRDIGLSIGNLLLAVLVPALETAAAIGNSLVFVFNAFGIEVETLSKLIPVVGTALLVAFGPAILASIMAGFGSMITAMITGLNLVRLAIMANPIGLIATAIAAVVVAAYQFRDSLGVVGEWIDWVVSKAVAGFELVKTALQGLGILENGEINVNVNANEASENLKGAMPTGANRAAPILSDAVANGGQRAAGALQAAGSGVANSMKDVHDASIARYESMNGKAAKEIGGAITGGGEYWINEVTGELRRVGDGFGTSVSKGGSAAGDMMKKGVTAGGVAAGNQLELAGNKVGGAIADILQTQAVEIARLIKFEMRAEIQLMRAESAKLIADAKLARAQAEQIRRGNYSTTGSAGGGGSDFGTGRTYTSTVARDPATKMWMNDDPIWNRDTEHETVSDGEQVSAGVSETVSEGPQITLKNINVFDPNDMVNVINTNAGNQALINFAKANRDELIAILGVG